MWIFNLFIILYNFAIIFVPIFLDIGIQIWNGVNINSTDFTSRTFKWNPAHWTNETELVFVFPSNYTGSWMEQQCPRPNFGCMNENCLEESKLCNGIQDCRDDEDESNCQRVTRLVPMEAAIISRNKRQVSGANEMGCINVLSNEVQDSGDLEEECGSGIPPHSTEEPPSHSVEDTPPLGAHLINLKLSENFQLIVSRETIVSLALLQLPAICLALYGIICAFHQPTLVKKMKHSLSACIIIFLPFSLVECFTLLEVEFAHRGVQFLLEKLKQGCQNLFGLCCDTCTDKTTNALDVLHFLPGKGLTGRDRALSVSSCKLIFGSCLQLCFQTVLLSGYTRTEDFQVSQLVSILSSAFIITKTATSIVVFKRDTVTIDENDTRTFGKKVKRFLTVQLSQLKQLFLAFPLLLSSLIFQSGTLFLTILVFRHFSIIYIVATLFINLLLSLLLPFPVIKKCEDKLRLTFKFPRLDQEKDERKVTNKKILRGLFSSWANLFIALRPVEELTYYNSIHMCLLQSLRFILNIITLIVLISYTWIPSTPYVYSLKIHLTVTLVIVGVAGLFNQLEMLCYFYFGNIFFLSKPPQTISPQDTEKSIEINEIENNVTDIITLSDTLKYIDEDRVSEETSLLHHDEKEEIQNISAATFPESDQEKTENKTAYTSTSESDQENIGNKAASTSSNESGQEETKNKAISTFFSVSDQEETENKLPGISHESNQEEIQNVNETAETSAVEATENENEDMKKSFETTEIDNEDDDNTAKSPEAIRIPLMTNISMISMRSVDASCFFTDDDFDIVEPSQEMTKEEVKKTFNNIQEQGGRVFKEEFIDTMMKLFPRYNMEENRQKLDQLFDRLDKNKEAMITFRQFMLVTIAFSNIPLREKLIKIFQLIDENRDEELTYEEFEEVVKDILVLKEERKISTSLIEERFSKNTFRDMGMDADGKVNLRNFVEACTRQRFIIINYVENFKDGFLINQNA